MTDAQIRYHQLVETQRHDYAQEENWAKQLAETTRSNVARETLSRYATDVQASTSRYVADTNAAASKYAADQHYAASTYSADRGYQASIYATNSNAATQRYVSDQNARTQREVALINAETSRYATDVGAATQRYISDQNASVQTDIANLSAQTSTYRTDVESVDRAKRLEFEKRAQLVRNSLEARKIDLEKMRTTSQVSLNEAQAEKLIQDTANSIQQMQIAAENLELSKEAAQFTNELNRVRASQAEAEKNFTTVKTISEVVKAINGTLDIVEKTGNMIGGGESDFQVSPWD